MKKYVIYHHRTQGRNVEAVHILGICKGLNEFDYETVIIGPPGIDVNTNIVKAPNADNNSSILSWLAFHAPQIIFELLELLYNIVAIPRLFSGCLLIKPDFIYERYTFFNISGVIASRLAKVPIIVEVNDTTKVDRARQGKNLIMSILANKMEKFIFQKATGIAVVSGYLKDQLIESGIKAEKICITPNAIDNKLFDPETNISTTIRKRYNLQDKLVVGFAGSFAKWHRVDILIQACADIIKEFPTLHLLLIGDGLFRAESERLAAELGIEQHTSFTGRISHNEIPLYMAAMDIGVMPESNPFGSPMKVIEYMSMGIPTIAPRYGPLEEVIIDGKTGLLFPPRDQKALADCLHQLLSDDEKRKMLGHNANLIVLENHLWIHNVQKVLNLFSHNNKS